jgi:hypothetical protein
LRHRAICCCSAYSLKPTRALLFEIDMFFGEKASDCWPSVFNWESAVRESSEGFISEHFASLYRIYLHVRGRWMCLCIRRLIWCTVLGVEYNESSNIVERVEVHFLRLMGAALSPLLKIRYYYIASIECDLHF